MAGRGESVWERGGVEVSQCDRVFLGVHLCVRALVFCEMDALLQFLTHRGPVGCSCCCCSFAYGLGVIDEKQFYGLQSDVLACASHAANNPHVRSSSCSRVGRRFEGLWLGFGVGVWGWVGGVDE